MSQNMLTCSKCKVSQNESGFYRNCRKKNGYRSWCKKCYAAYQQSPKGRESQKKYRTENPDKMLEYIVQYKAKNPILFRAYHVLSNIRIRSKKNNIPFDITKQNLIDMQNESDTCPCCFEPFDFNLNGPNDPHSPSVDRIIPELGYVKSNVKMICFRCNQQKNDSSIEQLEQIVRYMKKHEVAE